MRPAPGYGQDGFAASTAWAREHLQRAAGAAERAAGAARVHAGQAMHAVEQQVAGLTHHPQGSGAPNPFAAAFDRSALPAGPLPPIEVRVCSWNLHGNQIDPHDVVSRWLAPDGEASDVVVVGVQELVDLGPRTMVLNSAGDEQRQAALEARIEQALQGLSGVSRGRAAHGESAGFTKVCSFGMVGLAMLIYVRNWLRPYVRELGLDRVKTGLDGIGGNKGGICARFLLGNLSACFVNVHLASGQNEVKERSQHLKQVLTDAFQGTSSRGGPRPAKHGFERSSMYHTGQHNLSIIMGDFNSRLDVPKDAPLPSGPLEEWLARDQILLGQLSSLRGYREGVICFRPTYKYKIGTDSFNTKRCPAWCDRIVYQSKGQLAVELLEYASFPELRFTSDHHPVAAHFQVTPSS
eukprot:TRINITY_DN19202_c0_g1_i2.p1 TRINITY_DN19202_c0_g1~~TRINITY_DN19202_c0_g1_i2.p1  ORF type:complete len:408 (-),score=82.56 TRINITY_DN19202_c0_g1_i2:45-1268(-)